MIESLMKNFHLPTDTLHTTLTPFLSRFNDQSINQKDDRIMQIDAVALKWMIKSLMKIFHLPTDTLRITLTPFSSRLNDQSIKETRLRIARILNRLKARFYFLSFALLSRLKFGALPRTYDLPIAFLNWPNIQLNIHTTENCANTGLG